MGMHEIESLVERTVRLIDRGMGTKDHSLRSIFWNLFDYQKGYDTGLTLFRSPSILVRHRYLYAFPLSAHPRFSQYQRYFESLSQKGFTEICSNPAERWHAVRNPVAGYYVDPGKEWGAETLEATDWSDLTRPLLYAEAGSPLWEELVANQTLTGDDAREPERISRPELFRIIVEEAVRQGDLELAAEWYQVGIVYELAACDEIENLRGNPHLHVVRELGRAHRLYAHPLYRGFSRLGVEAFDDPFIQWWWTEIDDSLDEKEDQTTYTPIAGKRSIEPASVAESSEDLSPSSFAYLGSNDFGVWDPDNFVNAFTVDDIPTRRSNIKRVLMGLWQNTDPALLAARGSPALSDRDKASYFQKLFSSLEAAHLQTGDTIHSFWRALMAERKPGSSYLSIVTGLGFGYLTDWIRDLEPRNLPGLTPSFFRGVQVYLGKQGLTLAQAALDLRALLQDSDAFVRANTGRRWAYLIGMERPRGAWKNAIEILMETEVTHPGALTPFLIVMIELDKKAARPGGALDKSRERLVETLCRRQRPEEGDPLFGSLEDLLAHLVVDRPALLRRIFDAGFKRSVFMAVKDRHGGETGQQICLELACDSDTGLAPEACIELLEREAPIPRAAIDSGAIRRFEGRDLEGHRLTIYLVRHPGDETGTPYDWLHVILPTTDGMKWTKDDAWRTIDLLLPPDVRGDARRIYFFPNGPRVSCGVSGPEGDDYQSITIEGKGVVSTWNPEETINRLFA